MRRANRGVGYWPVVRFAALGALLLGVGSGGCNQGGSVPTGQATVAQKLKQPQPQRVERLTLSPRADWQRLDGDIGFAVSPRFVGDDLVLLSGHVGKGLYLAEDTGEVHLIDASYRGPVELRGDGRVVCLPNRASVQVQPTLPGGLRVAGAETCPPPGFNPELGQVLHESDLGRWSFHPRRQELVFVPTGEQPILVEDRGPHYIRVSPDGSRVAYSLGPLPSPTLFLWEASQGHRDLGVGAHPVFHPDGLLIYSRPDGKRMLGSLTSVARAELRAHDLSTHESWNLTDTPDLAEMQPAISPDGGRLAFSDWRRGGAYLVTLSRRVDP